MRLLITLSVLFLTATIACTATPLLPPPINDPEILIDSDCCSIPITTGINQVQPTGAQTVTYDFFNDTPDVITSFIFQTMINAGLSPQAASSFTCMDNAGFFLGCAVHYDPVSGNLQYSFFRGSIRWTETKMARTPKSANKKGSRQTVTSRLRCRAGLPMSCQEAKSYTAMFQIWTIRLFRLQLLIPPSRP